MSDSNLSVTPEATQVTVDPTTSNVATQKASAEAKSTEDKPAWLDARLEQNRRALLKDLGIDNLDEAKELLSQAKAKKEAEKSDAQKRGELELTLKQSNERIAEMHSALSVMAQSQMSTLSDAQRSAVVDIAGDDPAKQIKTIEKLRPTWAQAPSKAAETVADTAPPRNAPKAEITVDAPEDPREVWAKLKEINPIVAARYAVANGVFTQ